MANLQMRRGEVQQRLAGHGWFAELDSRLAEAVLDAGRLLSFARGASLFRPEDDPGGIYGVVAGGVIISTLGRDGLPASGHIMRRGTWFGYGPVVFRQNRKLLAEANEPSVLLHVPLAQVDAIRARQPGSDRAFRLLAAYGETALLSVIADLLIPSADRRLAAVLLRVTGADRLASAEEPPADAWAEPEGVLLTQTLLADLANTSRQTVARFVDHAEREGWISWSYGRVRILDAQKLATFAASR